MGASPDDIVDSRYSAADKHALADYFLSLLDDWSWAHDRVEQVDLIGIGEGRITSTLTFTLPQKNYLAKIPIVQIPLAYLTGNNIRDIEVRDRDNKLLPILSGAQLAELRQNTLSIRAEKLLKDQWTDSKAPLLGDLFRRAGARVSATSPRDEPWVGKLMSDPHFSWLASELIHGDYLTVELPLDKVGVKQVLQLTYSLALSQQPVIEVDITKAGPLVRLARSIESLVVRVFRPLFTNKMTLPLPTVALAYSYKMLINVPRGLVVTSASARLGLFEGADEAAISQEQGSLWASGTQIRFAAAGAPRGCLAILRAGFVPDPNGILRTALYMSVLTSIALVSSLVLRLLDVIRPTTDASAAVLLAIPGILVAYVLTAQEHPFAVPVSRIVRGLIYATAGISIAGAVVLVLTIQFGPLPGVGPFVLTGKRLAWATLAFLSTGVSIVLWFALAYSKQRLNRESAPLPFRILSETKRLRRLHQRFLDALA